MNVFFKSLVITLVVILLAKFAYTFTRPDNVDENSFSTSSVTVDSSLNTSSRSSIQTSDNISLPVGGSVFLKNVKHTIDITEVKRGCFKRDCIPSVDEPMFISTKEAGDILPNSTLGIALNYKDEQRFYPFPMLETRELVNDVVAGDPLLISYCPLCGTGIVFDRTIDGKGVEFGVSGMLWQSNLLMYDRTTGIENRNLWSQVLGEAVVGPRAGQSLTQIPSDIMRFSDWTENNTDGKVLTTGLPQDPYSGEYLRTAFYFEPDFVDTENVFNPDTYIHGIVYKNFPYAFNLTQLPVGTYEYEINGDSIVITKDSAGSITFSDSSENVIPDVEGFWFSWKSAHPETRIGTII